MSGVGKTRILESIKKLSSISRGKTSAKFFGISWKIQFKHEAKEFCWSGEFGAADESMIGSDRPVESAFIDEDEDAPRPNLVGEELEVDGNVVATRQGDDILLNGTKTPKLSNKESLIHILKNEDGIGDAHKALDSILHVDHSEAGRRFFSFGGNFENLKKKFKTVEQIRAEDMPTNLKLALTHENCKQVFDEIVTQFQEAFPYVEEVGLKFAEAGPLGTVPRLYMKEVGVDRIIPEESFSSGMHRTLLHLSRMSLWPDGTVVLVDEFENSFGVNCIHYVTDDLQVHSQRMQFILTSHHPYIINNIDKKNWKIVSRKGSAVSVEGSELLANKSSHHEAFLQLLNLPQYSEGIPAE